MQPHRLDLHHVEASSTGKQAWNRRRPCNEKNVGFSPPWITYLCNWISKLFYYKDHLFFSYLTKPELHGYKPRFREVNFIYYSFFLEYLCTAGDF